jgi:hypothetical protein
MAAMVGGPRGPGEGDADDGALPLWQISVSLLTQSSSVRACEKCGLALAFMMGVAPMMRAGAAPGGLSFGCDASVVFEYEETRQLPRLARGSILMSPAPDQYLLDP